MLSEEDKKAFQKLVDKVQQGRATAEEASFIESYYEYFETWSSSEPALSDPERKAFEDSLFARLEGRIDGLKGATEGTEQAVVIPFYRKRYMRVAAAAAALFLLGSAGWWYAGHRTTKGQPKIDIAKYDVAPGGNKATLVLDGGKIVVLDSAADGNIASQGSTKVVKLSGGQLVYTPSSGSPAGSVLYNTLNTPVAGQYRLTLPDGTVALLNSASSIRYPTAFAGKDRRVEVQGEVYFEVQEDSRKPFIVETGKASVQVLGTHFNVMAYSDEAAMKTTLLEGKVKVTADHKSVLLRPGEQAAIRNETNNIIVSIADTEKETAWISGFFQFDETDLPTLMRQLRRWYDIDPVYPPTDTARKFGGRISRNLKLSEVLHILEGNNIHFKIDGRRLVVMPLNNP